MFLTPAPADDSAAIIAAQRLCKANAEQVIFKMMAESEKNEKGLSGLLVETMSVRSIGPIGDNLFGVILPFSIERGITHKINPDFWI